VQVERFGDKAAFIRYWNRRMALLVGFGLFHLLFLSFGDILIPYALLGLMLPFLGRFNNVQVLILALLINLVPLYEFILRALVTYPPIFMQAQAPVTLEHYLQVYGQGSYYEIFVMRMQDYFSFRNEKLVMYIPKELSLFLLGIVAARTGWVTRPNIKAMGVFFLFALGVTTLMHLYQPLVISAFQFEEVIMHRVALGLIIHSSEVIHGLMYIIGFILLWQVPFARIVLSILTYPGKLSLTNYLTQSLVCMVFFSGLGYYGKLTPSELVIMAMVIYVCQLGFSAAWLRFYQYGPLEYLWRLGSRRG
jgi:uncharacterized protein